MNMSHVIMVATLASGTAFGWIISRKHREGKTKVADAISKLEQHANGEF